MPAYLYTAPTSEPVTLQEAKDHLRLETALDDAAVNACIVAARLHIEEVCWRGLVTQVWELVESGFPDEKCRPAFTRDNPDFDGFELPKGNLTAVGSVKYLDGNGTQQTITAADYIVDTTNVPGRVRLAYGKFWPAHRVQWDAVRIRYTVGWAVGSVPQPLKQALLLLVSQMYEFRTPEISGTIVSPVQFAFDSLIRPYRLVRGT